MDNSNSDPLLYDQYYLEMFRRALLQRDQCAQERLQHRFGEVVLDWMRCHPSGDLVCGLHSEGYYVFETFKRFWQVPLRSQSFELNDLTDALHYLRASLNGVILDTLRNSSRAKGGLLLKSSLAGVSLLDDHDGNHEVRKMVQEMLSAVREQRLAYLLFHCGLKPCEIVRSYPLEFGDESEVSSMRRKFIEQLCNSNSSPPWLEIDHENGYHSSTCERI